MKRDVVELEERFQQLKSSRSALSAEMRATATALRTSGTISPAELDRSLHDYRELFGHFRAELGITSPDSEQPQDSTWEHFQPRIEQLRSAAQATERLQAVERLSVPKGFEATFDPVRQTHRDVTSRMAKSPWEETDLVQEVQTGRHPLCRLVSLVERLHDLSDDEWTTEMAAIQRAFGLAVSTAIARGKVTLDDDPAAS